MFFFWQLFLCVLPQDKSQWISKIKELRAWYSSVKEIVSCTLSNVTIFLIRLWRPAASDLCVYFLSFQHITNPRKAVGQQDLMINNPLSQDEGVKLMFIHVSADLAHQSMLVSHCQSPWKPCYSTPVGQFFYPRVSPPRAGWTLLPAVCWQCRGKPVGCLWSCEICESSGAERQEPRGGLGWGWKAAVYRASLLSEVRRPHREDSSAEGDSCV